MAILAQLKHAWNAFRNGAETLEQPQAFGGGMSYGPRPDRVQLRWSNERSIIASIYTRLGIDVAAIELRHCRVDSDSRYLEDINSGLNNCLKLEANIDQAARAFRQDIAMTLFDKGVAALVPIDTSVSPETSGGYDIQTLRVGEVVAWFPDRVRVRVYNEAKGLREDLTLSKKYVAIVENPLYAVMNAPNSTLQRLIRKLNLLDVVDDASGSGKLDIIIQVPYAIRSDAQRTRAQQRREDIEFQLKGSKYGIAYSDATEKIVQLNRPAENNLLNQIKFLTEMLYGQLGLTLEVMNGTADEKSMINYYVRTIEPLVAAAVEAMRRTFLTKTARTQGHWILGFRDPFKLVPISEMAEIADKFTRSEVATSNDLRQAIGWKPSKNPRADELRNTNMPEPDPNPSDQQAPIRVVPAQVTRRQLTSAPSES